MKKVVISAIAALSLAAPALAKEEAPVFVVATAVKDKPAVTFDKSKAYVMLRSDIATPLYLMKVPSPEDQAGYDKYRAASLAKAHAKYVKKQAEYDRVAKANAESKGGPIQPLPEKPVEPTDANFEFTPFALMTGIAVGPLNRFAKGDAGLSTYLEELTPGDYRVYGPVSVMPNGAAMGACFCMGSVGFTAKAGEIVDLGMIETKANPPAKRPDGDSSAPVPVSKLAYFAPPPPGTGLDARLGDMPVVPAKFRPVGKLPNYFGVTITRMPEMPGVLRYDRDRIVDTGK